MTLGASVAHYLIPRTSYLVPRTSYLIPRTCYLVCTFCCGALRGVPAGWGSGKRLCSQKQRPVGTRGGAPPPFVEIIGVKLEIGELTSKKVVNSCFGSHIVRLTYYLLGEKGLRETPWVAYFLFNNQSICSLPERVSSAGSQKTKDIWQIVL